MSDSREAALSAPDLLAIWETGQHRHDIDRALIVLQSAMPDAAWEDLALLPVGRRDGLLLQVRGRWFGPTFRIGVLCPRCGEKLEFDGSVDEFFGANSSDGNIATVTVTQSGYEIVARPLSSRSLTVLRADQPHEIARRKLLDEALVSARHGGAPVIAADLPEDVVASVVDALAAADPLADLEFDLACPACAHGWSLVFDIVPFLWREVSSVAQLLLDEVHELASAFGWHEKDILAMSAARRSHYLGRLRG